MVMIMRSTARTVAVTMTEMMMMIMISSLSPDLIILSVTSSLQELFPNSLLTIQEYSPDIKKSIGLKINFKLIYLQT